MMAEVHVSASAKIQNKLFSLTIVASFCFDLLKNRRLDFIFHLCDMWLHVIFHPFDMWRTESRQPLIIALLKCGWLLTTGQSMSLQPSSITIHHAKPLTSRHHQGRRNWHHQSSPLISESSFIIDHSRRPHRAKGGKLSSTKKEMWKFEGKEQQQQPGKNAK